MPLLPSTPVSATTLIFDFVVAPVIFGRIRASLTRQFCSPSRSFFLIPPAGMSLVWRGFSKSKRVAEKESFIFE
jgi:hypothetical protein